MSGMEEKVALVTGGSRGIGRAIVAALAQEGATVFAAARNIEALNEVAAEHGERVIPVQLDVTDGSAVDATVEKIVDDRDRIDILVNNAGITRDGLLMRMEDSDFDDVVATNLRSCFVSIRAVSKHMVRKRTGRIINIASVAGVAGNAGQANYAAAKAGLIGLTKSAAKELAVRNITVNAVAPGFVTTDMTDVLPEKLKGDVLSAIPLRRFGKAEEVAAVVSFLASDACSYMTGQVLLVDGGMRT